MTLLAGYQALLARHCGQRDFAVGTPVAGRTRPEVENLVGMFVNMLALRVEMADDPCFAELLTRTRRVVLDGLRYQEMPFEQVVAELGMERDVSQVTPVPGDLRVAQLRDEHRWLAQPLAGCRSRADRNLGGPRSSGYTL